MGAEFMRVNYLFFLPLLLWTYTQAYSPFRNFNSTVKVNDIEITDNIIWVASNGGLARMERNGSVSLESANKPFNDIKLTALTSDDAGGLWIGSEYGTLYYYKDGRVRSYNTYRSVQWDIRDLSIHGSYLLVSSSKGLSVFDIEKKASVVNATSFQKDTLDSANPDAGNITVEVGPVANCAIIYGDTVYVGFTNGYAKADINARNLSDLSFNRSLWNIDERADGVKKFLVHEGELRSYPHLAVIANNSQYYADSSVLYKDGNSLDTLPSIITALEVDSEGTVWCGTSDHYFYSISRGAAQQHEIPGMFFGSISRVAVGPDGKTWFIPRVTVPNTPWWQGVMSFDGTRWQLFNRTNVEDFGSLGDGIEFVGISRDAHGNMWFGANGSGLRKYDTEKGQWSRYFAGVIHLDSFYRFEPGIFSWNKSDAIATDSSGYLWAAAYNCNSGKLVCYNPAVENPAATDYWRVSEATDIQFVAINVDHSGRIFAGSTDGQLLIISHDGTPLDGNGVNIEKMEMSWRIFDMTSTSDGCTWLATDKGIYRWRKETGFVHLDNSPDDIRTIEQENNSVLWLGSEQNGLIKWQRSEYIPDSFYEEDRQYPTVFEGELTTYTESDGLISNAISWLDIDRNEGVLWIATEDGVSAFDLGYMPSTSASSDKEMTAYPNPLRKQVHSEIVFGNVAAQSIINIYSVKGQLLATLNESNTPVRKSDNVWMYIWEIPQDLLPGTYVAVPKAQNEAARPQKVIIRP